MRVKVTLAYDGSLYLGFQVQNSTEQTVANQLYIALNRLNITTKIVASGRTDAKVHATNQVIHFDVPSFWQNLDTLTFRLNQLLPPSIRIKRIKEVHVNFHARFDAKKRTYRYILAHKVTPFEVNYVTHIEQEFDLAKLDNALKTFEGTHDFKLFAKSGSSPVNSVRTVYKTRVYNFGHYTIITIKANAFLRSQIRLMVHAALSVAQSKLSIDKLIAQRDGTTKHLTKLAPPNGLYLTHIYYD